MTVSTLNSTAEFVTNGVTTDFPFYFKFLNNEDLAVTYIDPLGVLSVLALGTNYTVNGAGNDAGGSITTNVALLGPGQLVVSREMDAFQQTSLRNQGKFLAETHEDVFDKLTMLIQQGFSILKRALTRPFGRDYFYAENRRIASLADPVDPLDATNKKTVSSMIVEAIGTGQGPSNNAVNVLYVTPGELITTVAAKLRETVSLSDFTSLREALAYGQMVHVPAGTVSIDVSPADSPFVLPNLYRVNAEGDLTINLGAGVHVTATGDICRVGVRNSTIKLQGSVPAETKATAVTSITGTPGDWSITYTLANASGAQVGDFAKLFDVGPLPILNGDNAASYILRSYPLMGELYTPLAQSVGSLSYNNGGGSVAFSAVSGALTQYMHDGDLLTSKGQTRALNVVGGSSASIVGAWTNGGVTGSRAFYITRPNSGTIGTGGVASATVAGTSSAFLTEGNIGDVLLANGVMSKIIGIANNGSLTLDAPVTLANGTPYSILQSAACLHEGAHEITAVAGNSVTVRNRSQVKPPINGVTVDEFKIIKTVLKQNGDGDGVVFDQNGSLRLIDNLVLAGKGAGEGIGLLLQSRIPTEVSSGGTSFGNVTQGGLRGTVFIGENVGITRFLRASMVGHGCLLNARKMAATNNQENGIWVLEGGVANLRRVQISGGQIGLAVNAGGTAVVTEVRLAGCANDGIRSDANATTYGEAPMAVACGGMNYRILDSTKSHLTDGVSLLSFLSGVYVDGGSARIDRMAIGACARNGIEIGEQASVHASSCWVSGTSNTAGFGYGVSMGSGSNLMATDSAFVGNEIGDINIPAGTADSSMILQSCFYSTLTGITRVNSPSANNVAVWDGAGADTGSSVPVAGSGGGAIGASTGAALSWTRDKDRYEFDARVTITTLGTASGFLTLSLPFSVPLPTPISAINQTTGALCGGYVSGSQAVIYSSGGAFPAASGNTIAISGVAKV